jgi:hypothetical protein
MIKKKKLAITVGFLTYVLFFSAFLAYSSISSANTEFNNNLETSSIGPSYSNVTIISDGYNGDYWNNGTSEDVSLEVGEKGKIYAVWEDNTDGSWGTDDEIMYSYYSEKTGWIRPYVISDGFNNSYWNDARSEEPSIAVDNEGNVHVVWWDETEGIWGGGTGDFEIMYVKYTPGEGWSNVSIVSDGYQGSYWNNDASTNPEIEVDKNRNLHVVWQDYTDGPWGEDIEIMYASHTPESGWSNITVISDGYGGTYWNDIDNDNPSIAVDDLDNVHVVYQGFPGGKWGSDEEIMYVKKPKGGVWSNVSVISDGYKDSYWNDGISKEPSITVNNQEIHVVWYDGSEGSWTQNFENEIMHTKYIPAQGWSNVTIISDSYHGEYWSDRDSENPSIDADEQGNLYVAYFDETEGPWGGGTVDSEIMYTVYTKDSGWSFPKVISDGFQGSYWNNADSYAPSVAVGHESQINIAWHDHEDGYWGDDVDIMYVSVDPKLESDNQEIPGSFTLSTNAEDPDEDGTFNLLWTESKNAEEYNVYINKNGTQEIFASGLTDRTFRVTDLSNGTYNFEVEAINEQGKTKSNEINVSVEIPPLYQDSSTGNETQEEENTPSIPFGNYYLGFLIIGVISVVAIVYYKQKEE